MVTDVKKTEQLITQSIESLAHQLKKLIEKRNSPGRIRTGVWIEKSNTIIGLISFTPHGDPEEESIETSIKVKIDKIADIFIDICWSDGEIIDVVAKKNLVFNSHDDLKSKLINYWENNLPIITTKMTELIILDQPPRYRPH